MNPAYPVQIGIDGGDGVNHYTVPNSLTPDIVNITRTSNINQPGLWVFKLDDYNIIGGVPLTTVFMCDYMTSRIQVFRMSLLLT